MRALILKSLRNTVKHWYLHLLGGILFLVMSVVAITSPSEALLALSIVFSLSFLIGGLAEVAFALANRGLLDNWGWPLTFGMLTFIVGILLLMNPGMSVAALVLYIGFLVLFRSIASISFALDIRKYTGGGWGLLLALGILGTIFSFILIWNPLFAGMTVVILIALNFLFAGLFSIALAFQLKSMHKLSKNLTAEQQRRVEELDAEIHAEWSKPS